MEQHPCATCRDNCCAPLRGLKVTRAEFDRVFSDKVDRLSIIDNGDWLQVSSTNGACPNLREGLCQVYDDRPMECRLFPYTIETITPRDQVVQVYVHGSTHCPAREQLKPAVTTAHAMVSDFCAEAFPHLSADITIIDRPNPVVLRVSRAARRFRLATTL